jgi:hypothetical protein
MHSVPGNANLNMHSFMLALEDWRKDKGKFPKKVYWQVDGGSENANKDVLALCEYLVAKTPIEEIVLTRLPVGHTHEVNIAINISLRDNLSKFLICTGYRR